MNFGASSLTDREAYFPNISGFKINNRLLEYDKPTSLNGYWLSDFSLYNHTARKPSNTIQNEFVLEAQDGNGNGTGYGKAVNNIAIRIDLPNTEVVKK